MSAFTDSLGLLLAAYPRWDLTPEDAATWAVLLSDVPAADLAVAACQLARESKFPPTIAEWRERALTLAGAGKPSSPTIGEAWDEVLRNRALHSRQRYESRPEKLEPYAWSSEAVSSAARMVGWNRDWSKEAEGTTRAQFERYLRDMRERDAVADAARSALEFAQRARVLLQGAAPLSERTPTVSDGGRKPGSTEDPSKVRGSGENGRPAIQGEQGRDEGAR